MRRETLGLCFCNEGGRHTWKVLKDVGWIWLVITGLRMMEWLLHNCVVQQNTHLEYVAQMLDP